MSLVDRRLGLLFACFLLLFSIALVRAAWLQAVQGGDFRADAQSQQTEMVEIPGVRGTISDRTGADLALSEDAASVFATPFQIENAPRTASKLAGALDKDESEILKLISDRDSGFEYLARKVDLCRPQTRSKGWGCRGSGSFPTAAAFIRRASSRRR